MLVGALVTSTVAGVVAEGVSAVVVGGFGGSLVTGDEDPNGSVLVESLVLITVVGE